MKIRCLFCLLLCTLLLFSCQTPPDNTVPPSDNINPPNDDPTELDTIAFIQNGATEYTIMRPELTSTDISDAAVALKRALTAATGVAVGIDNDWVERGTAAPTDTLEILVGLTNRTESIEAHAALKETEYTIRVMGSRLVIVGYDDACTVEAVEVFINQILGYSKETGTYTASELVLPADYQQKGNYIVKNYLNEHDKSSPSMYLDKHLSCHEEQLLAFDDPSAFAGAYTATDRNDKPECIGFELKKDNTHWNVLNLPTDSFAFSVDDKLGQSVKLWVYINDIDLLACDHDAVYDKPQTGSGTLYITFADKQGNIGHAWQHTLYGSGWHEIELSFACHNVAYGALGHINYENLTQMSLWCNAKAGLMLRFDDMRFCTYESYTYNEPEAPYNGRWLSTCDYEAPTGPILTEWYGSYFDPEEMTQGSSSVAIVGHKENVDHRVCVGVDDVYVSTAEDTVCFDMYISNLSLLGTDWQLRFEHNAQAAHYSMDYALISRCAVNDKMQKTSLKKGWNHIQIPLCETALRLQEEYKDKFTDGMTLTQLVFYIAGAGSSEKQNYLIRYDNIYVTKTANLEAAKAELAK